MSESENISKPVVEAHGLTKVFRDFWGRPKVRAVNGIDFTVGRGEVFGLLGPNGSGKSTTVKMLLGLLYPSRGHLEILGASPRQVAVKRRIGYLPEDSYLYRYLTASETLDFFGALFGMPASERRKRSEQLLEMVGLSSSRNRPVGEFSKGMARRIGLAQALINDPELVILDEPTAGLDPIGCREVKDVIMLLAERGKTIILCSHLLADVEDVCDHVAVLYGGRVCAQGALKEMLAIEDKTRIVAPRLAPATLDKVLNLLRESLAGEEFQVDRPSMNLEEFFLDVVRRAREMSMETAGAHSGGAIAQYLRSGSETGPTPERQAVLEALARTTPPEKTTHPPDNDTPDTTATTTQEDDKEKISRRLDELMEHDTAEKTAGKTEPEAAENRKPVENKPTPDDLKKTSDKLKQLLDEKPFSKDS